MNCFEELHSSEQLEIEGGYPGLIDFEMIGQGILSILKGLLGGKNSELFK